MFRFYSALSPNGTPEKAALLAALDLPHVWELDEESGRWSLEATGLLSFTDVFFSANEDMLFIHQNAKIFKIPFPANMSHKFSLQINTDKGDVMGFQTIFTPPRITVPQNWFSAPARPVDLRERDVQLFHRLGDGRISLPIFAVHGDEKGIFLRVPPRFLYFLSQTATPKAVCSVAVRENIRFVDVVLSAGKLVFFGEAELGKNLKEVDLSLNGLSVHLTDAVLSLASD